MPTKKVNFTTPWLAGLACSPGKTREYFRDAKTPGLQLCVTATGTKTFTLYRRVNGSPVRFTIGRFPDISIDSARKEIARLNLGAAAGQDPRDEKRKRREEATFQELFDFYLEHHARTHKRSWRDDQKQYDRYLKPWKGSRLSSLTQAKVRALHARIGRENGQYAANRLVALLHCVFSFAGELGFTGANPATGVKRFREKQRARFLQADELPRFFQALNDEVDVFRDYFLLALFIGARKSNTLAMRWDEINLERGTWTIPQTKNGESLTVPLSPQALEVLKARRESAGDSPWVFPGRFEGRHMMDLKSAWARILERSGLTDLRIHDLRRTLGSWQAATGASLPVIGKTLGHLNQAATAIYARLSLDPVREAVTRATEAMVEAGKPREAG